MSKVTVLRESPMNQPPKPTAVAAKRDRKSEFKITLVRLFVFVAAILVLLLAAQTARSQDIGIRAAQLPPGYVAKASKQSRNGVEWLAMSVTHPDFPAVRAQVAIEKRAMPTHSMRLAASMAYINTLGGTLTKGGFKMLEANIPDLQRADYSKNTYLQMVFSNEKKEKLLCGVQIWFTDDAGHCGAVISSDGVDRKDLLEWMSSVRAADSDPNGLREWRSKAGHKINAKLVSTASGKAVLAREDGKEISVPVDQLSAADQAFIKTSTLKPTIYSDAKHAARTFIPAGFAKARSIRPEAQSYRHLDGSGIHFVALPWPAAENSLAKLLAMTSQQAEGSISKLTDAAMEVLTTATPAPVKDTLAQYYGVRIDDVFLLVVAESKEETMPMYAPIYDKMMKTIRTK